MYLVKDTVTLTGDTAGNDTQYTKYFTGMVHMIKYTPIVTGLTSTSLLTINIDSDTDRHVWYNTLGSTAVTRYYPRRAVVRSTGAGLGGATDHPVDRIPLASERLRVSLATGTTHLRSGTIDVYVEGAVY